MKRAIALTEKDNVATMIDKARKGEDVEVIIGRRKTVITAKDERHKERRTRSRPQYQKHNGLKIELQKNCRKIGLLKGTKL